MEKTVHGDAEMKQAAAEFVAQLAVSTDGATILALSGDLGAGKTTFTKGIAKALGVESEVTSPTFVIEKIYSLKNQKWERLIHIDMYRLNSAEELPAIGWDEFSKDPSNLIVIEWPEQVEGAIPPGAVKIEFKDAGGEVREISY
jgi:tRNA threonylcarbamoyladenosine biosynthesis protein TsaE